MTIKEIFMGTKYENDNGTKKRKEGRKEGKKVSVVSRRKKGNAYSMVNRKRYVRDEQKN